LIAELFFIVDLLKKRELMADSPAISQPVDYDWRLKKPKPPPKVGYTGEGPRFRPPITIDPTKIDYGQLEWKPDYKKGRF
jgi:hypothetical protein